MKDKIYISYQYQQVQHEEMERKAKKKSEWKTKKNQELLSLCQIKFSSC